MKLADSMTIAWRDRAQRAAEVVIASQAAPALFKPDAIEQARRDYYRAVTECERWMA